tara:strand:- start:1845 stop:2636 length:792 start_codon:yes stop_codon:yes gene_type:complete
MTLLSIVLPTKNSEKYISKTLDSIQSQTFLDWELLICDCESKDKTIDIINNRIKNDSRIKIISNNDVGVAHALNIGFNSAKGQIFTWLNSDDYYASSSVLEIVNKRLINQTKFDYLVGDFFNVDENGKIFKSFISYVPNYKLNKIFFYNQIFTGSLFFSNNSFKSFKEFNIENKYAFEYELLIYLIKNYYGKHENFFMSCFRITENQLSSNKIELKRELLDLLNTNGLIYSNSRFLQIKSYLNQGSFLRFLFYKFYDFFKNLF